MSLPNIQNILEGYRQGIFPMANSKQSKSFFWVKPEERGIIPIGKLHISRSLKKYIKANTIQTTLNTCFEVVVKHCANRQNTWINSELSNIYQILYENGYAISIEVWLDKQLIGGLFGIKIGSCFCGEGMFSLASNGSKLALLVTMARLNYNDFKLFDMQFPTSHLESMGGCTISQTKYEKLLAMSINDKRLFHDFPSGYSWSDIMHLNNQVL